MLTQIELGWMAGIVDGEGSFSISYALDRNGCRCFKYQFGVGNTNRAIIDEVKRLFGVICCRTFKDYPIKPRGGRKSSWAIQITDKISLYSFCKTVLPHLVGKRAQAEIMLKFLDDCPGYGVANRWKQRDEDRFQRRMEAMLELKRLNRYRVGDSPARDLTASSSNEDEGKVRTPEQSGEVAETATRLLQ